MPCSPLWAVFLTQGSNPSLLCLVHWQADCTAGPPGKLFFFFLASFAVAGFYGEFSSIQLVLLLTLALEEPRCYQSTDKTATSIKWWFGRGGEKTLDLFLHLGWQVLLERKSFISALHHLTSLPCFHPSHSIPIPQVLPASLRFSLLPAAFPFHVSMFTFHPMCVCIYICLFVWLQCRIFDLQFSIVSCGTRNLAMACGI